MDQTVGFLFVLLAGLTQGTYAIFLKDTRPLKWENFWGLYVFISLILAPLIFAYFLIPNFFQTLSSVPLNLMIAPLIFGALWGLGNVLFGISILRIGLALTYTIVLGLVTLIGTTLPILINHTPLSKNSLAFLGIGLIITLSGIILSGYAGVLRDGSTKLGKSLRIGFLIAALAGIASSMLNIGFVTGKDIGIIAQNQGVSIANSSSLIWVVVLFGGFLVNIGYVIYLFFKNNSFKVYKEINSKAFLAALSAGVLWYISFALFGQASGKLGNLGPSVGWAMLISLSIVVSTIWSIKFGEWGSSKKALKMQLKSIGLIVIGIVAIAISVL